ADPFSLKTVHWTVFRALEPSKPSKSAIASVEKFTRQLTTLIARYFLKQYRRNACRRSCDAYICDIWEVRT
ncbi:MAG: hypothetical protein IJ089_12140, partial [Clostridia bacterium]|nr:hypothetical protein [Clostridia bacterium]